MSRHSVFSCASSRHFSILVADRGRDRVRHGTAKATNRSRAGWRLPSRGTWLLVEKAIDCPLAASSAFRAPSVPDFKKIHRRPYKNRGFIVVKLNYTASRSVAILASRAASGPIFVVKLNYEISIDPQDITGPEFLIRIHQRHNGFCFDAHVVGQVVTHLVHFLSAQMPGRNGETFASRSSRNPTWVRKRSDGCFPLPGKNWIAPCVTSQRGSPRPMEAERHKLSAWKKKEVANDLRLLVISGHDSMLLFLRKMACPECKPWTQEPPPFQLRRGQFLRQPDAEVSAALVPSLK